jgi:hypothetical protein
MFADILTPPLPILITLFIVFVLIAGFRVSRMLDRVRQGGQPSNAIHQWYEQPLSSWKYEPFSMVAILIHSIASLLLAGAALVTASKPTSFDTTLFSNDITMFVLLWIVDGGSLSLAGYLVGSLATFPLASLRKKPIPYAITEQGIVHGNTLLPWRLFSYFSVDHNNGVIRFYSAFAPDLPSVVSKPTPALFGEIAASLQKDLPERLANGSFAWYRTKYLLIPAMILVCFPFVAAGWLAFYLPRELALFAIAMLMNFLALLGSRCITLYSFGVSRVDSNLSLNSHAD